MFAGVMVERSDGVMLSAGDPSSAPGTPSPVHIHLLRAWTDDGAPSCPGLPGETSGEKPGGDLPGQLAAKPWKVTTHLFLSCSEPGREGV